MKHQSTCAAAATTQPPFGHGHNSAQISQPFGLKAAWLHFANQLELRRLAKLHVRIERRQRGLDELVTERQLIMNRCIRRMRRQRGKN
jgi:hypothetical protein